MIPNREDLGYWWHAYPELGITRDDDYLGVGKEKPEYPANVWALVEPQVDKDLFGKRVLDIGCNSGWYSIKLCKRGAYIYGVENEQDGQPHIKQCRHVAEMLLTDEEKERFELRPISFLDIIPPHTDKQADIIWFFGVYYHLENHEQALPKINQLLKHGGLLYLESAIEEKPRAVEGHAGDSTNHFIPSRDYLIEDLTKNGFEVLWMKEQNRGYAGHRIIIKAVKK